MDIKIRSVEPNDYQDIQQLHSMPAVYAGTLHSPLPSEDFWRKRLHDLPENIHMYVAEIEGKVVAYAGVELQHNKRRKHAAALFIAVHDNWQRQGIATQLLKRVVDIAENWLGVTRIELTVFEDNEGAIKLYEHAGFQKEGIHVKFALRNGKLENVIAMARVTPIA